MMSTLRTPFTCGPTAARNDHGRVRVLLADAERDAAAARTAHAQGDVLEAPVIAALAIVDDDVAVLDADLVQIVAVEARRAHAVEARERRQQRVDARAAGRRLWPERRDAPPGAAGDDAADGTSSAGVAVTSGRVVAPVETLTRPSCSISTDSSASTRLRLSARSRPNSSDSAGNAHFGLGRGRNDLLVAIADDDVEHANGDARPARALDLRAADLDGVVAADVVLDRGGQPRRRHVEADRPLAEPPPQQAECAARQRGQDQRQRDQPAGPAMAREPG